MLKITLIGLIVISLVAVGATFFKQNKDISNNTQPTSKKLSYVALGDSYTIGQGISKNDRWPNQLVEMLVKNGVELELVANPSVTGYTTLDLIREELDEVKNNQPDFITIQIGVNDYFQGYSEADFSMNFKKVLTEVKAISPTSKILLVTVPDYGKTPTGSQTDNPEQTNVGVKKFNDIIKGYGVEFSIPVADIFDISLQSGDKPHFTANDGLHPSAQQYRAWLEVIQPKALEILKPSV